MNRLGRKGKWYIFALVILFGGFTLYRVWAITQKKTVTQRTKRSEIPVQISPVVLKPITYSISMTGDILPLMQVDLFPKISGYIENIYVRLGDKVLKGQLIAQIDKADYLQKVKEVEARVLHAKAQLLEIETGTRIEEIRKAEEAVRQAESRFNNAKIQRERIEALYKRGVISKKEYDISEMEFTVSEAQLESAREHLKLLKEGARKEEREAAQARLKEVEALLAQERLKLQYTQIVAPFSGEISRRYVDPGSLVSPSTPIVNIVHADTLKVIANILEKDVPYIKIGMKAKVRAEAFPDKIFEGKIMHISSSLDLHTRTLQAEIYIPNQDRLIKPGMFSRIEISLIEKPSAMVIPKNALIEQGKERFVFVVKGNKAIRRSILTGFEDDKFIEVKEGVSEGDFIVIKGQESLRDGSSVKIIEGS